MTEIYIVSERSKSGYLRIGTLRAFVTRSELVEFLVDNSDKAYSVFVVYNDRKPRVLRRHTIEKMRSMEGLFDG